jgi:hypothetical protein
MSSGKETSHTLLNLVSTEGMDWQPFCLKPEICTKTRTLGSTDWPKTCSNLQILSARWVTWRKFYTENPLFWSDLVPSAWCAGIDTHFLCEYKNCNSYAENMWCHRTIFNHLSKQVPQICAPSEKPTTQIPIFSSSAIQNVLQGL